MAHGEWNEGMPAKIQQKLNEKLVPDDVNHLVHALKEFVSQPLEVLAQQVFKLSMGDWKAIESNQQRNLQIMLILQKWIENAGCDATFKRVCEIFKKAGLMRTLQHFWSYYESDEMEAGQNVERLHTDLASAFRQLKIADAAVSEDHWSKFFLELNIEKRHSRSNTDELLYQWLEKVGYHDATLTKLKNTLRNVQLRRLVYCIEMKKDSVNMSERFLMFLEKVFHSNFENMEQGKVENVLRTYSDGGDINEQDVFNKVLQEGNAGFHKFMKRLKRECGEDFSERFGDDNMSKLWFENIPPKPDHFMPVNILSEVKNELIKHRFIQLVGPAGSGKSECAVNVAEWFHAKFPVSFVWFLNCYDARRADESFDAFQNELINCKYCDSKGSMTNDLKALDVYILLVFDGLHEILVQQSPLDVFQRALKDNCKAHVLATTINCKLGGYHEKQIIGFSECEVLAFLKPNNDSEKIAALKMRSHYKFLPPRIASAQDYCRQLDISYQDFVCLLGEASALIEIDEHYKKWQKKHYKSSERQKELSSPQLSNPTRDVQDAVCSRSVFYFWDIFTCPPPAKKCVEHLVNRIALECGRELKQKKFVAVANVTQLDEQLPKDLHDQEIMTVHCLHSEMKKQQAAELTKDLEPSDVVVFITGDASFKTLMKKLRSHHLILIHPDEADKQLLSLATVKHPYSYFTQDLPPQENYPKLHESLCEAKGADELGSITTHKKRVFQSPSSEKSNAEVSVGGNQSLQGQLTEMKIEQQSLKQRFAVLEQSQKQQFAVHEKRIEGLEAEKQKMQDKNMALQQEIMVLQQDRDESMEQIEMLKQHEVENKEDLFERDQKVEELLKVIEKLNKKIQEQQKEIEEQQKEIEEQQKEIEEQQKEIEELKKGNSRTDQKMSQ